MIGDFRQPGLHDAFIAFDTCRVCPSIHVYTFIVGHDPSDIGNALVLDDAMQCRCLDTLL